MSTNTATALAHPNIAFIKYWGNQDEHLRIPLNNSISMNLKGLETITTVTFDSSLSSDQLRLNGKQTKNHTLNRVSLLLDHIRELAPGIGYANVESKNNFPTGAGIASSSSAFAALSLASSSAAGLDLDERQLTTIARLGSGSASRSVPSGFVEWQAGDSHDSSYAESLAAPEHWKLIDLIAIVTREHKTTGSTEGHQSASTSALQNARINDTTRRLDLCRTALMHKDFTKFADIVELDCNLMHAVMLTSQPALMYWEPTTLAIMKAVQSWRKAGLPVCYTIDAGANVHVLYAGEDYNAISEKLDQIQGVKEVLSAHPGGPAKLLENF